MTCITGGLLTAERVNRVECILEEAHGILDEAISKHVLADGRALAGVVILFSGGNDSTTLAHIFKDRAHYAAHANTGIGVEATRQFVRDTCKSWDLPLIEKTCNEGETYRDLVLGKIVARSGPNKGKVVFSGGFPGPALHWLAYQRLKERALEKVRRELVSNPRKQRVVFVAGRRMNESSRRKSRYANSPPMERKGSTVWVSPLVNWTAEDLNSYRLMHPDMPHNEVTDFLHMSGECLCGAFAHKDELDELGMWFPEVVEEIRSLEREVTALGTIPEQRCKWGWASGPGLCQNGCNT